MTEEEEVSVAVSQHDGSSGDEARDNASTSSAGGSKKRKRGRYQKTSCELCKARKVKCDRAEPACSWCARHNRTCVYLERQRPGSRIGFGLELEAKVNRIDALLQTLGRRVEEHIADGHAVPPQTLSPAISTHAQSQIDPYAQERNRSSPASGAPRSTPSGMNVDYGNATLLPQRLRRGPSALSAGTDLPPQDVVYTLVDLYFKHCNTWSPILDRKTTFSIFFGSTSLSEADRVLLHAIVATTLRFLKDARFSPEMRAHYHETSRQIVQMYAIEHASVEALRALVIVCLDELGTSNGPRGWNLLALLAQNARQLSLCEESSVYLSVETSDDSPMTGSIRRIAIDRPQSWIEDEGRRRLAWMVYLLDRYATIATTTFDFMLDDNKMKRVLPCSYDLFSRDIPVETRSWGSSPDQHGAAGLVVNKPDNLGSFSYHCEILRILSKVHDFLKTPLDITSSSEMAAWRNTYRSLDASLDSWLRGLPGDYSKISALCHSDPASRVANWFMLHSAYVTAVVRLHSSAAYPTVRSHLFAPSHYAMQRCLSAVQSLGDIAQDVYEASGLDHLGPPFIFSLWVAARLLLVHAATIGCPVDSRIEFFIEILGHVGQYWEVADTYAKVLARAVQRGRQGHMSFHAMRRSAHGLVTLTASARQTGIEPASTQITSLSELDNIDIFDFFNYPKISEPAMRALSGQSQLQSTTEGEAARLPDPESDWLGFVPQGT
ncbi:hypothetical protein LLEC1_04287 [Akanthomyces lecanii]|uniref:Zn(2)-C6 fungal-type domain-containing protein n=1 Tax=Cordyceps confragosa TaxID=2714763 RepID=A0A179I1P4_CORDF|nr:hypothetical protein LLEC1_04287 [Akanthomyces lecanii]